MDRTEKSNNLGLFATDAGKAPFILVAEYRGTKVSEINEFRRELEKAGMKYRVIKNTLARRAFAQVGVSGLDGQLKGMSGFVFSSDDAVASAKALRGLMKVVPQMQVRAGYFDGGVLGNKAIEIVADMPSKEDLLARLLATLVEGPRQLVSVIQAPARDLVQVLKNYEDKLSEASA
jgi:large subunit ribosomal protein L10